MAKEFTIGSKVWINVLGHPVKATIEGIETIPHIGKEYLISWENNPNVVHRFSGEMFETKEELLDIFK